MREWIDIEYYSDQPPATLMERLKKLGFTWSSGDDLVDYSFTNNMDDYISVNCNLMVVAIGMYLDKSNDYNISVDTFMTITEDSIAPLIMLNKLI